MADPQDGPQDNAGAIPPAKKSPAKKAPAKKAPAKAAKKAPAKKAAEKSAAKKVPAKKAPPPPSIRQPQPALQAGHEMAALGAAPEHAALTSGTKTPDTGNSTAPARSHDSGRARLPLSLALAAVGLAAVVLSRFRRG